MFAQVAKTGMHFSRNGPGMGARLLLSGPQRGLGMCFGQEFQDRQTVPKRLALPTLFDDKDGNMAGGRMAQDLGPGLWLA